MLSFEHDMVFSDKIRLWSSAQNQQISQSKFQHVWEGVQEVLTPKGRITGN